MANEVTIGGMTAAGRALAPTDLLEIETAGGLGRSITGQEIIDGVGAINFADFPVTSSITLPTPCPSVVYVNFTTPGQAITLPDATAVNAPKAGDVIYFKVAITNSENFDINTSDGTTLLTAVSTDGNYNDYILSYSQNDTENGTPIRDFVIPNLGALGTAAYQNVAAFLASIGGTLSGNLVIDDTLAVGPFSGLDINKTASDSPAQINVYNSFPGTGASAEINALSEGAADAVFRAAVNGGDVFTWGYDASAAKFKLSAGNALGTTDIYEVDPATFAFAFTQIMTLNADATTGLQAVTYQQLNSTLTISGTTHTLASTDALRNSICTNVAGCTITINTASLQDGESANFQSANAAGVVIFSAGTGTVYYCPAGCNKLVTNGNATVTRQGTDYYVNGTLTA
jgi:hypothetical protein